MTADAQPGLTLVSAPKFCTSCGQELPEAGGMCPACPHVDAQRRAVMASYFGQMQALRDIDTAEHAAELRVRADMARAEHAQAAESSAVLEEAVKTALAAERKAADRARASVQYHQKTVTAEHRARRDRVSPEARTEALMRMRAAADVARGDQAAAEGARAARASAEHRLAEHRARVAVLEDAAVGAERAADNPPARVPPSIWTCLLAHPMTVLLLPDLDGPAARWCRCRLATGRSCPGLPTSCGPRAAPRSRGRSRPPAAARCRSSAGTAR